MGSQNYSMTKFFIGLEKREEFDRDKSSLIIGHVQLVEIMVAEVEKKTDKSMVTTCSFRLDDRSYFIGFFWKILMIYHL